MSDPRDNRIEMPIPIPSPCCGGKDNLCWGRFYGAKVYVCKTCHAFIERKDALPLIREARRQFKATYKDLIVNMTETATGLKQGKTLTWKGFFGIDKEEGREG